MTPPRMDRAKMHELFGSDSEVRFACTCRCMRVNRRRMRVTPAIVATINHSANALDLPRLG